MRFAIGLPSVDRHNRGPERREGPAVRKDEG
jgi:hypothetical protein